MENTQFTYRNIFALKKLIINNPFHHPNMYKPQYFYKKNEIPKLFINVGANIKQSSLNALVYDQIERIDNDITLNNNKGSYAHKNTEKRLKKEIEHLKFLIKLGASTKKLIKYYNIKALNFPEHKNRIIKVQNAILSAIEQRQEILDANALEKQLRLFRDKVVPNLYYRPPILSTHNKGGILSTHNKGGIGYQNAKRKFNSSRQNL